MFISYLDYVLQTSIDLRKENGIIKKNKKKARSRYYPAETITDVNYTDDLVLLTITIAQAESLLRSLEQAAGGIGLHENANKIEFMCFKGAFLVAGL